MAHSPAKTGLSKIADTGKRARAKAPVSSHRTKRASRKTSIVAEPDLVVLLSDPEVRLMMQVDKIDERQLRNMLEAVSVELKTARAATDVSYRSGVGILLLNACNEVFVARRADTEGDAWQMPQGGIDPGESPRKAALRELREEIGTDKVEVLAESSRWLYYDLPKELAQKAWDGRWRGQRQKWLVMLFKGQDSEINLATEHPEFNAWRWVPLQELSALAVSFKRRLYLNVLGEFATLFRD
jgi:putative (di)nucleoside polyphosphate hydrolase